MLRIRPHRSWALAAALLACGPASQGQPKAPAVLTPHHLSVTRAGDGSGTVVSAAGGIDCGNRCGGNYSPGVPVQLTARSGTGLFAGWRGDCSGTQATCLLTMTGGKSVTARFERPKLVVDRSSEVGRAMVTSTPEGIRCGGTCAAQFDAGVRGTLQVSDMPAGWYPRFDNLTGNAFEMNQPAVRTRLVGVPSLTVRVSGGPGAGRIESQPPGLAVEGGATGGYPFPPGSTVNLRLAEGNLMSWNCGSAAQANCRTAGSRECTLVMPTNAAHQCTVVLR